MIKKTIYLLLICFSVNLNAQNKKHIVYIKSIVPLSKTELKNISSKNNLVFVKDNIISKILNSNIYRAESLTFKKSLFKKYLKKTSNINYVNYYSNPPPPPYLNYDLSTTPSFVNEQLYLNNNPGLNIKYAWEKEANGKNIKISVIEYGVNLNHEEFKNKNIKIAEGYTIHKDVSFIYSNHGTSVAGIIFSDNGNYGITGLAHNAREYTLYPEWSNEKNWDRPHAFSKAIDNSSKGDIILIEGQINGPDNNRYLPAEFDKIIWDLTKAATEKGIIVIEPAANGYYNLDSSYFSEYKSRGNSGAIMVGASVNDISHNTHSASNFGLRVDLNSWGQKVITTGADNFIFLSDINKAYQRNFNGTSSASALIAGCVIILQSYYFDATGQYLSSKAMKNLLIETGYKQSNNSKPIGTAPNLKAALEKIDLTLNTQEFKYTTNNYIKIFTSKFNKFLHINFLKQSQIKKITIYNSIGKIVYWNKNLFNSNKINLETLTNGIYYISLKTDNKILKKKIIIF